MRYVGAIQPPVQSGLVSRLDFSAMPDGLAAIDDTGKAWTFVQSSGSVAVAGGSLVTSGGGYITTPDASDWDFGRDEFCLEAIVEITQASENPIIAKWSTNGGLNWFCGLNKGGRQILYYYLGGGFYPVGGAIPSGLRHLAWYRNSDGNMYMSVDGAPSLASQSASGFENVAAPVVVGGRDYQSSGLGMKMRQLRVRRGPGTAYSASKFTPPDSI